MKSKGALIVSAPLLLNWVVISTLVLIATISNARRLIMKLDSKKNVDKTGDHEHIIAGESSEFSFTTLTKFD